MPSPYGHFPLQKAGGGGGGGELCDTLSEDEAQTGFKAHPSRVTANLFLI